MHVCIIGVGPLGRRHAEGVVMSGTCTKLTILDLSYDAIGKTKQFLSDLPESDISTEIDIEFIQQYGFQKNMTY